jgi:prepilin-type N-terminal cleavage/methylation domain-containing protein
MHAMKTKSTINNIHGFTLVELMVVVLLTAIAVIAIYRGYTAFSSSADAQEQIIEMQQNLRIGMHWLEKDLRRAGMEEEDDENAGFILAAADSVEFTMDLGGTDPATSDETWLPDDPGDGGLTDDDERLTYKLVAAPLPSPVPGPPWTNFFNLVKTDENNGDPDDPLDLPIITNVDALNFVYLAEDGSDTLDQDTTPDDPATGRLGVAAGDLGDIYAVEIAIVVRTTNEDLRYTNNEQYRNLQGSLIYQAPGDHFRRRISVKRIKIRNAGL